MSISNEIARQFHLPPIKNYLHSTRDWYSTFLIQTDYIVAKITEAQLLGETQDEDYTEIITARKEAREAINAIDAGIYEGEEAMQEIIVVKAEPYDGDTGKEEAEEQITEAIATLQT